MAEQPKTFVQRAAASSWVAAEPGLAETVAELHVEVGGRQRRLAEQAVGIAQPGPVHPFRLARHAAAATASRALRLTTSLPAAVTSGRPFTDPEGFLRDAALEAFVDQLALGGAASAEIARQITDAGALFPAGLRAELGRRDIRALPIEVEVVQDILDRTYADRRLGPVHLVERSPFIGTPVSQAHAAVIVDGRRVAARVRRPRIARDLDNDSRLAAGAAAGLGRIAGDAGAVGPRSFVVLSLRQSLEATDLRYEALDLVELGMVLEDLDVDGIVVPRPVAGLADRAAVVTEHLGGVPLAAVDPADIDVAAALRGLAALTVEAALVHGVFWADPSPDHLVVLPDGRLGLAGVGTLGRFTPELRVAGVRTLKGLLTGDHEGMVESMRAAGALAPDTDVDGLLDDLQTNARLDLARVLMGGEDAILEGLETLVGIMLAHRLQPPVEVTLFVRTLFAVGRLAHLVDTDGGPGLAGALLPLLPRLPEIIAAAEAAAE